MRTAWLRSQYVLLIWENMAVPLLGIQQVGFRHASGAFGLASAEVQIVRRGLLLRDERGYQNQPKYGHTYPHYLCDVPPGLCVQTI